MASFSTQLHSDTGSGFAAALGAFMAWGTLSLYWSQLTGIDSSEILAHRIFWSLLTIGPLVLCTGRMGEIRAALASPRVMFRVLLSTLLIGVNWYLYIWAVTHNHVIEASLGYYINPLVNVLLGRVFLSERLTRLQMLAVFLATVGVLWNVVGYGQFPWLSLALATTFGAYGLCRKTVDVESAPGLFLETLLLFPLAVGWLFWLHSQGQGQWGVVGLKMQLLLMGTGAITLTPLLLFAYAARHLPLSTLGLIQYVSPTSTFLLGIFVFKEPVTSASLVTFGCIWCALAIYTVSSLRRLRGLPG